MGLKAQERTLLYSIAHCSCKEITSVQDKDTSRNGTEYSSQQCEKITEAFNVCAEFELEVLCFVH